MTSITHHCTVTAAWQGLEAGHLNSEISNFQVFSSRFYISQSLHSSLLVGHYATTRSQYHKAASPWRAKPDPVTTFTFPPQSPQNACFHRPYGEPRTARKPQHPDPRRARGDCKLKKAQTIRFRISPLMTDVMRLSCGSVHLGGGSGL